MFSDTVRHSSGISNIVPQPSAPVSARSPKQALPERAEANARSADRDASGADEHRTDTARRPLPRRKVPLLPSDNAHLDQAGDLVSGREDRAGGRQPENAAKSAHRKPASTISKTKKPQADRKHEGSPNKRSPKVSSRRYPRPQPGKRVAGHSARESPRKPISSAEILVRDADMQAETRSPVPSAPCYRSCASCSRCRT